MTTKKGKVERENVWQGNTDQGWRTVGRQIGLDFELIQ